MTQPDIYDLIAEGDAAATDRHPSGLPIGEFRPERLTCGTRHLPGCWNPNLGLTACICGAAWWVGQVGTWHSIPRYAPEPPMPLLGIGIGAVGHRGVETEFYGWDTYFIHAPTCPHTNPARDSTQACPDPGGTCGTAEPTDYATAAALAHHTARTTNTKEQDQ